MGTRNEGGDPPRRKDGKPFKPDNVGPDGDYLVGKGRPPEAGKFRAGDGRQRGRREKGTKNLDTVWKDQLRRKLTINGETRNAREWLVDGVTRRGISRSDRAAEIALAAAARIDGKSERKLGLGDHEIIEQWLVERLNESPRQVSDDADDADATWTHGGDDADQ